MRRFFAIVTALTLMASSSLEARAAIELIANGGFELNPLAQAGHQHVNNGTLPGSNSVFPNWGVGLTLSSPAGVDLVRGPAYGLDPAPNGGSQFIDLNGTPGPGNIYQVLTTVVDQWYQVSFIHASNNVNSTGGVGVWDGDGSSIGPATQRLLALFNDMPTSPTEWVPATYTFQAKSTQSVISFGAWLPASGDQGPMVDNISVQAVPEPMTVIVWGALGVCGSVAAWRTKKQQLTASSGEMLL